MRVDRNFPVAGRTMNRLLQPFRSPLLRMTATAALVTGLVMALHNAGYFESVEARWIDAMGQIFKPPPSEGVVVIAITDADFERSDLFASTSPLNPGTLKRLVERVAEHRPALVAIDIELQPVPSESEERAKDRRLLYSTLSDLFRKSSTRWVLVQPESWEVTAAGQTQTTWEDLQNAFGRSALVRWVSARMPVERGLIRRIPLWISGQDPASKKLTILGAVAEANPAAIGRFLAASQAQQPPLIRYTGGFTLGKHSVTKHAISASAVLEPAAPQGDSILTGKTIIIGGTHRAGRDYHWTPLGEMAAVEIWAEAVDSWFRDDAPREPWGPVAFLTETAVGVAGGWMMQRFGPIFGCVLIVAALGPLTLLLSWLAFGARYLFINFLPSFFAVQLHQRIELWSENRLLRREVRTLEVRVQSLLDDNSGQPGDPPKFQGTKMSEDA